MFIIIVQLCLLYSYCYAYYCYVMFIIIVFDRVSPRFSPVSLQDFYCSLPRDQSRDVTPRLGVPIN